MLNYTLMLRMWASIAHIIVKTTLHALHGAVFLILASSVLFGSAYSVSAQQSGEIRNIDTTLKKTGKQLAISKAKRKKTKLTLLSIEKQIAERALRYEQTLSKSTALEQQANLLENERNKLHKELIEAKQHLARLVESAYLMGRQSGLKIALSENGTQFMARINHYARSIATLRQNQLDALQSVQQRLGKKNKALDHQRIQLEKLSAALTEDQRYLGQLKKNRLATVNQLDRTITDSRREIDELQERKAKLEKVLRDIVQRKKALAEQKLAREKRAHTARSVPEKPIVYRTVKPGDKRPSPARAKIVSQFGDKREKSGLPWSGILMEGPEGTDIRAIISGEIVYADWLQGYGQLVIVDHGQGLMSLYGHNKRIRRSVGDRVKQSDIIASMGDTAGLKKPALYFEIRQNGVAQDPLRWCCI